MEFSMKRTRNLEIQKSERRENPNCWICMWDSAEVFLVSIKNWWIKKIKIDVVPWLFFCLILFLQELKAPPLYFCWTEWHPGYASGPLALLPEYYGLFRLYKRIEALNIAFHAYYCLGYLIKPTIRLNNHDVSRAWTRRSSEDWKSVYA